MQIELSSVGRRFNREWIFRHVTHTFAEGSRTLLTGGNGSGKSTLLQVVAGNLLPSEGKVHRHGVDDAQAYRQLSMAAPYLELMEEFTLAESISFQAKFKPWRGQLSNAQVLELSGLTHAAHKAIRHYSSGMKQRARLLLAIMADTPLLLLDEPCANLDRAAMQWYAGLVSAHIENRTVIVCSNQQPEEHFFCTSQLSIEQFKP
ncbi:MAG: ATP-binding cassette domain-containing protein [Bacteroidia bacterium]|jgi:ABC-type multidrug transport system ATPase subunit|nr:ATP-binding cassette domain-containing protein [Bacteroidia bacterium]